MALKIYYKESLDDSIQELSQIKEGCWIHIDEATTSDLEELSQMIEIDSAELSDALDKYEIPRIERSNESLLIFTRSPIAPEFGLYTSTLTFILEKGIFVSISPNRSDLINAFIEKEQNFSTRQNTKLFTLLLSKVNQEFTSQIRRIRYNVLSAEKEMIHVESDDITVMTKNEEVLNQYLSSLTPIRNALTAVHTFFGEEDQESLEDRINSIRQSEELCNIVLKSIRSLRDAYQIIFTNNLHKTIKLLTSLTIILSIPTMIASVYGMNVDLPLAKNTFAFGIVMGLTALFSVLGLWLFKRKGWL